MYLYHGAEFMEWSFMSLGEIGKYRCEAYHENLFLPKLRLI